MINRIRFFLCMMLCFSSLTISPMDKKNTTEQMLSHSVATFRKIYRAVEQFPAGCTTVMPICLPLLHDGRLIIGTQLLGGRSGEGIKVWNPNQPATMGRLKTSGILCYWLSKMIVLKSGNILLVDANDCFKELRLNKDSVEVEHEGGRPQEKIYFLTNTVLAELSDGSVVSASVQFAYPGTIKERNIEQWKPSKGAISQNKDQVTTFKGHTDEILCLHALDDGRFLSGSQDRTVRLWNPSDKQTKEQRRYIGHESGVTCIASLQNNTFVSGDNGSGILLWNLGSEKPLKVFHNSFIRNGGIRCLIPLGDGKFFSGSKRSGYLNAVLNHYETPSGAIQLWDSKSKNDTPVKTLRTQSPVRDLTLMKDGSFAVCDEAGEVTIWNIDAGGSAEFETRVAAQKKEKGESSKHAVALQLKNVSSAPVAKKATRARKNKCAIM